MVGQAFTVRYVSKDEEPKTKQAGHYIDRLSPGQVLFVSGPPGVVNALYGGLMSRRAKALGAVGTIVDGRVRDLQEHRDLEYTQLLFHVPSADSSEKVFARDTSSVSPQEKLHVGEVNEPVMLQSPEQPDTLIDPGDYLIGDVNGVVCLPKELAEGVLALIPSQVEADEKIAEDLAKGRGFEQASKERRAGVKKATELRLGLA
ncbi:MAG: hypothetical protein LQ346_000978 [Caloplaca aetnensis]|nr:MAG: hypothetical protein LQ346_000978 [Caloplaca aetnensis]